jgi:hypothetical protein
MGAMRIIFVGDLSPYSRSTQRCRTLRELGHEVFEVPSYPPTTVPERVKPPRLILRILNKLGWVPDLAAANTRLLARLAETPCDLVWIEKGVSIRPQALQMARQLVPGVRVVSYSEDDMTRRHNYSRRYVACLPHYDCVFTTKSYNTAPEELPALGARRVVFVDKSFDPHTRRPLPVTPAQQAALGGDVGFIGTFERARAEAMLALAQRGVPVRVFGNGWRRWVGRHPLLRVENRPLLGDDFARAIGATRINLCFLRKLNRDLQTDRSVEIPACGGFMLAERTAEHQRLFSEDLEAAYFDVDRPEELFAKVEYYLAHEDIRATVAERGRARCFASDYTHANRLKYMLAQL